MDVKRKLEEEQRRWLKLHLRRWGCTYRIWISILQPAQSGWQDQLCVKCVEKYIESDWWCWSVPPFLFFLSAFIGPFVSRWEIQPSHKGGKELSLIPTLLSPFSSAISDDTGNSSSPFYFLVAMSIFGLLLSLPLNNVKARKEQRLFIEEQAKARGVGNKTTEAGHSETSL